MVQDSSPNSSLGATWPGNRPPKVGGQILHVMASKTGRKPDPRGVNRPLGVKTGALQCFWVKNRRTGRLDRAEPGGKPPRRATCPVEPRRLPPLAPRGGTGPAEPPLPRARARARPPAATWQPPVGRPGRTADRDPRGRGRTNQALPLVAAWAIPARSAYCGGC